MIWNKGKNMGYEAKSPERKKQMEWIKFMGTQKMKEFKNKLEEKYTTHESLCICEILFNIEYDFKK